jgi:predicted DNA-binding transcriptional regulator YafY
VPTNPGRRQYSAFLVVPQVERRHRLIEELRATAPRRLTGAGLAKRIGVSVRTVERDIAELVAAGVPIAITRGRTGGYSISAAATPAVVSFTTGEIAALIASIAAIGPYSSASAMSALDKLTAAIAPSPRAGQCGRSVRGERPLQASRVGHFSPRTHCVLDGSASTSFGAGTGR